MKSLLVVLCVLALSSCSTGHKFMRGSVVMKLDKSTAHICLGNNEVKAGDEILFYFNNCERIDSDKDGLEALCTLENIGSGKVVKTINSHYSMVKTDGHFKFDEGTLVQINKNE